MRCSECSLRVGEPVEVTYSDGTSVALHLCEKCQRHFGDGGLVERVERLEPSEP